MKRSQDGSEELFWFLKAGAVMILVWGQNTCCSILGAKLASFSRSKIKCPCNQMSNSQFQRKPFIRVNIQGPFQGPHWRFFQFKLRLLALINFIISPAKTNGSTFSPSQSNFVQNLESAFDVIMINVYSTGECSFYAFKNGYIFKEFEPS